MLYPASDLDRPQKLLSLLGSFWAEVFADRATTQDLVAASARCDARTSQAFADLLASLSRFTVPVRHRDDWRQIELLESERTLTDAVLAKYDGTYTYQSPTYLHYDEPVAAALTCWPAPTDLEDVLVLTNRLQDASRVYIRGVDFDLVDGALRFRTDVFADDAIAIGEITEDNEVMDRIATLWAYGAETDPGLITQQFGYALGLEAPSSVAFRRLVNAIYDILIEGPTRRALRAAVAAMADAPLTEEADEVVEVIFTDQRAQWVCTDRRAYRCPLPATVRVAVGDVLRRGTLLTDAVTFHDIRRDPAPAAVAALAVGREFLGAGYAGELVFENKTVPLVVEEDVDGYTKVSFELGGAPSLVTQFWDEVHARGVTADATLAHALDRRTDADTEPTALALPATVNPLEFLLSNVFRQHLFILTAQIRSFGPDALGLHHLAQLRNLLPLHTTFILLAALDYEDSPIIMDGPGQKAVATTQKALILGQGWQKGWFFS
jgi:hypothetical protein